MYLTCSHASSPPLAGIETYPYAYYKWFDSLLDLGRVRQNHYLRRRSVLRRLKSTSAAGQFYGALNPPLPQVSGAQNIDSPSSHLPCVLDRCGIVARY